MKNKLLFLSISIASIVSFNARALDTAALLKAVQDAPPTVISSANAIKSQVEKIIAAVNKLKTATDNEAKIKAGVEIIGAAGEAFEIIVGSKVAEGQKADTAGHNYAGLLTVFINILKAFNPEAAAKLTSISTDMRNVTGYVDTAKDTISQAADVLIMLLQSK